MFYIFLKRWVAKNINPQEDTAKTNEFSANYQKIEDNIADNNVNELAPK